MMKIQQVGKRRGFGLAALALCGFLSTMCSRPARAVDPEAEGNVVIEINNTPDTNDDVLSQGGLGALPCNARLVNAQKDMTVVLVIPTISATDPSRRLSFSLSSAVWTTTLTLPKDGTRKAFLLYATANSLAVGDAKIEAHKDTASGDLKTTGTATVYWFKAPMITITSAGIYSAAIPLDHTGKPIPPDQNIPPEGYSVRPDSGKAVYLSAGISLMPSKSLSNAPQLSSLKVGILQNVKAGSGTTSVWRAGEPTDVARPDFYRKVTSKLLQQADDCRSAAPLYDAPVSLATGLATSSDAPEGHTPLYVTDYIPSLNGQVTFRLWSLNLDSEFIDWCALLNSNQPNPYWAVSTQGSPAG